MAILARPLPPGLNNREIQFVVPPFQDDSQSITPEEVAAIAIAISQQVADQSSQQAPSIWGVQARLESLIKI